MTNKKKKSTPVRQPSLPTPDMPSNTTMKHPEASGITVYGLHAGLQPTTVKRDGRATNISEDEWTTDSEGDTETNIDDNSASGTKEEPASNGQQSSTKRSSTEEVNSAIVKEMSEVRKASADLLKVPYPGLPQDVKKLPKDLQQALEDIWVSEQTGMVVKTRAPSPWLGRAAGDEGYTWSVPPTAPNGTVYVVMHTSLKVGLSAMPVKIRPKGAFASPWKAAIAALQIIIQQESQTKFKQFMDGEGVYGEFCGWRINKHGLFKVGLIDYMKMAEEELEEGYPFLPMVLPPRGKRVWMRDPSEPVWFGVQVKKFDVAV